MTTTAGCTTETGSQTSFTGSQMSFRDKEQTSPSRSWGSVSPPRTEAATVPTWGSSTRATR
uniref:Uncharacterized protein n=1 Tax=Molossus molossus TaxID=27622 RepID=A0A7J8I8L0_MOLMO|nr:hypothetical protein HJG59_010520 [Molossus molossus]